MTGEEQAGRRYVVRVYTVDGGAEVQELANALIEAVKSHCPGNGSIEVVDVLEQPDKAVAENIFATPAVVKELPEPMRRVIGDISDPKRVLVLLGLLAAEEPEHPRRG